MNILFISPFLVEEHALGGMKRMVNFIRHLRRNHRVFVVCLDNKTQFSDEGRHDMKDLYVFRNPVRSAVRRAYHKIFSRKPAFVMSCMSSDMAEMARTLTRTSDIDLVHIEFTYAGEYVYSVNRARCVTVLVDQELNFRSIGREIRYSVGSPRLLALMLDYMKLRRYELAICREFDKVFTITEEERKLISSYDRSIDVDIYPNVVDTEYFTPQPDPPGTGEAPSLVFTGNYLHRPNEAGILWFHDRIYPLITREIPEVMLSVVGANPTERMMKTFGSTRNVTVTGQVGDIRPYLWNSTVFVNPIITGGGMRGKVLEAMASQKPVVSTSIGAEGIDACHGEHFFIAERPKDFAGRVLELLRNRSVRSTIGKTGRELVVRKYDEGVVFGRMERSYEALVEMRKSHRGFR